MAKNPGKELHPPVFRLWWRENAPYSLLPGFSTGVYCRPKRKY
jgi:hypothetical protein